MQEILNGKIRIFYKNFKISIFYKREYLMDWIHNFYKCICCITDPKYPTPYNFDFNSDYDPSNVHQFQSNYIRTSKYTWYDFLIKALLLQYTRIANVYFLFIGIISSIPAISPVSSVTIWIPIIFVLTISLIRQGYEDFKRYQTDRQLNHKMKCLCFNNKKFEEIQWSSVKVGSVIKVLQNEFFPADLIFLASSQPSGNAFIQTSSLDGQKSLKIRKAYNQTNKYNCEQLLQDFKGQWIGIVPDKDMHKFSSKMKIEHSVIEYEGNKQFLYRGAKLKNTKWVYGLVIYTGKNTKIMMNMDVSHNKISNVEIKVNRLLILIFILQMILCIIPTVLYGIFRTYNQANYYYIDWPQYQIGNDCVLMFFSYFILMSTFIPISLVISIQFVKVFQAYFINKDKLMYSTERNQGVTAKTFSLNQQLGQIQYVFSDKTGTLTKNQMEFKIALIGDYVYGDQDLIKKCQLNHSFKYVVRQQDVKNYLSQKKQTQLKQPIILQTGDCSKSQKINNVSKLFKEYFQLLSTTHQVLLQKTDSRPIYRGPSPDQICLVNFAKENNFQFIDSGQSVVSIKINQRPVSYELLQTFSFTSDRKRMSIVFKDQEGNIRLYIKGADNVIKQRLGPNQVINLDQKVNKCSSIGLRTLLVATKIISQKEYQKFKKEVSLLEGNQKQQKYDRLISDLESNLTLIGGTAILDELQDLVPETIKDLLKANIKVWMLTGDKLQTAENIAKSCNLIQKDFHVFKLSVQVNDIQKALEQINKKSEQLSEMKISNGIIIEGSILSQIIGRQQRQNQIVQIFQRCEAVICCRLLPLQKAEVVNLIKNKTKKIVLSIGDGQNDVPMIKAANIGIGLFGEQGMGAVQASDYGMPEFRMLRRLIFVHGRWNYMRISEMILYFFYKNIIFTVPRLVFGFYSGFSTQRVFDDVYVALYNAVFTALPLVVRAVLQQDINYVFPIKKEINGEQFQQIGQELSQDFIKTSIYHDHPEALSLPAGFEINKYFYRLFPKIYFVGQQNCIFNVKNFLYWLVEALVLGTGLTIITMQIFSEVSINQQGWSSDLWLLSLNLFSGLLLIVTIKLATHTKYWSWILVLSILVTTFGLYIGYMWFSNYKAILSDHILGTARIMWGNIKSLFYLIFCVSVILIIDGIAVTVDFHFGQYASKMRLAVYKEQEMNKNYLKSLNLPISQTGQQSNNEYVIQHQY